METLKSQKEQKIQPKKSNANFFKPAIQKKLSVGSANDSYEVEADHIADKVMKMSELSPQVAHTGALVQRKCAACEQEEKLRMKPLAESVTPLIQRSSKESTGESHAPDHVENQINSSRGSGSVMDYGTKSFMESRFGTDFSNVKIHTGSEAVQMSRELNAQAFAVGSDIYFNEGKYNPNSDSGKHLLAHELTHTVQQSGGIQQKVQKSEGYEESSESEDSIAYESEDAAIETKQGAERCRGSNVIDMDIQNFTNRSITIPSGCVGTVVFTARWNHTCGYTGCTGESGYNVIITNGSRTRTHNLTAAQAHCGDAEQPDPIRSHPITLRSGTNNIRINVNRSGCEEASMHITMTIRIS
jgi:hypothetical protein